MVNIAIVEDEAMYAKQLQEFLLQYQKENGEVFNITVYSDGDQIVHKYKSQFDIILMDVEMKFMVCLLRRKSGKQTRRLSSFSLQIWRSMRSAAMQWMRLTMC